MNKWEEMSPKERRIALAKDVIKHLDSLEVLSGNGYLTLEDDEDFFNSKNPDDQITREDCDQIRKNCAMCARGALFISRVDLFNSINWSSLDSDQGKFSDILRKEQTTACLDESFSEEQLGLIEAAFEQNDFYASESSRKLASAAENFSYDEPKDRLRQIMENIIKNGEFDPTDSIRNKNDK